MHKFVKIEKVLLKIQIIFLFIILYLFLFKNIFILKLFVLIPMLIISIVNSILTLKARKLKNEVLELSRESERELARESEKELKKEILEDKMKEEEFFIELRNLIWNEFPYCRFNKREADYTLSYLKNFENLIIIDVEFIFLNIGRHLRYQIKVNDIKQKGEKLEKELSAKILNDIKKFQIDDID
jgi:hypothetical protein